MLAPGRRLAPLAGSLPRSARRGAQGSQDPGVLRREALPCHTQRSASARNPVRFVIQQSRLKHEFSRAPTRVCRQLTMFLLVPGHQLASACTARGLQSSRSRLLRGRLSEPRRDCHALARRSSFDDLLDLWRHRDRQLPYAHALRIAAGRITFLLAALPLADLGGITDQTLNLISAVIPSGALECREAPR